MQSFLLNNYKRYDFIYYYIIMKNHLHKRISQKRTTFRTPRKFITLKVKTIKKWKAKITPKLKKKK